MSRTDEVDLHPPLLKRWVFLFICVECSQTYWAATQILDRGCICGGRLALWPGKEILS